MKDLSHNTHIVHTCEQIRDLLPLQILREERYHSSLNQLLHSMAVALPLLLYPHALGHLQVQRILSSTTSLEKRVPLLQVLYQEQPPPSQVLLQVLNEIHQRFHKESMVWHLQHSSLRV